jgi:hypothetical protein
LRILVDTSALLALSRRQDQYHELAVKFAEQHLNAGGRFLSTSLVLSEFHSHLLYLRGPTAASESLSMLLSDPLHEWADVSAPLIREARERWLVSFADQKLSLVDAVSFEIMRREKLTQAFAFDRHFRIAGFTLANRMPRQAA